MLSGALMGTHQLQLLVILIVMICIVLQVQAPVLILGLIRQLPQADACCRPIAGGSCRQLR